MAPTQGQVQKAQRGAVQKEQVVKTQTGPRGARAGHQEQWAGGGQAGGGEGS